MSRQEKESRVVRARVADPADRRTSVKRATGKVKARAKIDFVRSVRE